MIYSQLYRFYIYITILTTFYSCSIYSFSGASISENTKTIQINYIRNEANLVQPTLSNLLTETLINKCQRETNLTITNNNGNVVFSGKIIKYEIAPIAIQENEIAAQNRLTISVEIDFINRSDNSQNFKQTFTEYADFNSNDVFSNIEEDINIIIANNLIENIFNNAFMNW